MGNFFSDVKDFFMGSTDPSHTERVKLLTPEQEQLLGGLVGTLNKQLGAPGKTYGGSWSTPASGIQSQLFKTVEDLLKGTTGKPNALAQSNAQKMSKGFTAPTISAGTYDPAAVQQWYTDALVNPAMQTWEKDIVPQVQEKFISQNAGSSGAANRAIADSAEDVMSNLNSQLANAMYGEKQAFDNRDFTAKTTNASNRLATNALNLEGLSSGGRLGIAADTAGYAELASLLGIGTQTGAQQYGIEQGKTQANYQKWLSQQPVNNPWLQYLNTALGVNLYEPVVHGAVQKEGWIDKATKLFGAVM